MNGSPQEQLNDLDARLTALEESAKPKAEPKAKAKKAKAKD